MVVVVVDDYNAPFRSVSLSLSHTHTHTHTHTRTHTRSHAHQGHSDIVFSLSWIDDETLVSGSRDHYVAMWNLRDLLGASAWSSSNFCLSSLSNLSLSNLSSSSLSSSLSSLSTTGRESSEHPRRWLEGVPSFTVPTVKRQGHMNKVRALRHNPRTKVSFVVVGFLVGWFCVTTPPPPPYDR